MRIKMSELRRIIREAVQLELNETNYTVDNDLSSTKFFVEPALAAAVSPEAKGNENVSAFSSDLDSLKTHLRRIFPGTSQFKLELNNDGYISVLDMGIKNQIDGNLLLKLGREFTKFDPDGNGVHSLVHKLKSVNKK